MNRYPNIPLVKQYLILLGVLFAIVAVSTAPADAELSAAHNLQIELIPAENKLIGSDDITITTDDSGTLAFRISQNLARIEVMVDNDPRNFELTNGRLLLKLEPPEQTAQLRINIRYSGIFDDPVPSRQKFRCSGC